MRPAWMSCYIHVLYFTLSISKPSHMLKYIWHMNSCSMLLNLYLNSTWCVRTTSRLYVGCQNKWKCPSLHYYFLLSASWIYASFVCGLIYYLFTYLHHFSWDSIDSIRTWAGTGRPGNCGSIPARGTYNFLVHKASRLAVTPHRLLLKWVSRRAFCRGKGAGCKITKTWRLS